MYMQFIYLVICLFIYSSIYLFIHVLKPLSIINPSFLEESPWSVVVHPAWQTRQSTYLGERSPKRRYGLSIAVHAWTIRHHPSSGPGEFP